MAASNSTGMQPRQRSISLPSRLTNLTSLRIEPHLNKLNSLHDSSYPLGLDFIQSKLMDLADLYISSDIYLTQTTTSTQHTLINQGKSINDALTRSDRFLTILTTVRDLVSAMKDQLRDLQSAIRRRSSSPSYVATYVNTYMAYRKKSKKEIARGLNEIKQMEQGLTLTVTETCPVSFDPHDTAVFKVMTEVALATLAVLKSLLVALSLPPAVKTKGWSVFISKLKLVGTTSSNASRKLQLFNEVSEVDIILSTTTLDSINKDMEMVQGRLRIMDDMLDRLETAMECVYRRLIQTRVSFLNMLIY